MHEGINTENSALRHLQTNYQPIFADSSLQTILQRHTYFIPLYYLPGVDLFIVKLIKVQISTESKSG